MKIQWLPWLIFTLFGFYLLGNNFSAKLGMIDDHEIAMFLGSDGKINATQIPSLILSTEVGEYGHALRYRPIYYSFRIIETALWRDNAQLWYGVRYVFSVFAMVLLFAIVSQYFPMIISYLFVFALFTLPFWPDILTRLGPSEIYAVPALMLFVYGYLKMWRTGTTGLWQMSLGYLICVGSKENFLILLPILLLLAFKRIVQKKITVQEFFLYLVCTLFTLFIGTEIVLSTQASGVDVYGTHISYLERIKTLYAYKRYIVQTRHLELAVATIFGSIILFFVSLKRHGWKKTFSSSLSIHLLTMGVIIMVIASQSIFYNNSLPTNGRYDFPGIPLFSVLNLVAIHALIDVLPKALWGRILKMSLYIALVSYLLYVIFGKGYAPLLQQAKNNALITTAFAQKLDVTTQALRQNPTVPLIMISHNYINFEPIVSLARYLSARGITNPIMLSYAPDHDSADDTLSAVLSPRLTAVMQQGPSESLFARFSPLRDLYGGEKCYSISFDQTFSSSCINLATY